MCVWAVVAKFAERTQTLFLAGTVILTVLYLPSLIRRSRLISSGKPVLKFDSRGIMVVAQDKFIPWEEYYAHEFEAVSPGPHYERDLVFMMLRNDDPETAWSVRLPASLVDVSSRQLDALVKRFKPGAS